MILANTDESARFVKNQARLGMSWNLASQQIVVLLESLLV